MEGYMKKIFALTVFLLLAAMNMNAQNITWNISGANPAQYRSITNDELWRMFESNRLEGNHQKYKITTEIGSLIETATALSLLAVLSSASAGTELSSKFIYFKNLPKIEARIGEIEVYFSRGVILEDLDNNLNIQVKIPVIPVDGYRVL
jgi:hypothetical protein